LLKKIKILLCFIIIFFFNEYLLAESSISHYTNSDNSKSFDISFSFNSIHNVKKNYKLLTDYEKISRFNPSVAKVKIIGKDVDKIFLKTTFKNCVLFFCREMIMYEALISYCESDNYCIIRSEVIPKYDSPVLSGRTDWIIKQDVGQNRSEIIYKSKFNVFLSLPPFFGESIFKKTINRNLNHLNNTINNFEF